MKPWACKELLADIARLAESGQSDGAIAAALGCHKNTVYLTRTRHGIPAGHDRSRPHTGRAAGLAAGWATMRAERDALAARYGLPPGLTPRQVQIVLALARGPLTREEIADAIGATGSRARFFGVGTSRHGRRSSLLTDLAGRGLVFVLPRVIPGAGRKPNVYALTPLALSLLASHKEPTREDQRTDALDQRHRAAQPAGTAGLGEGSALAG